MAQLCSSAIGLSSESRGWAQAANYTWTNDEDGTVVLSSAVGGSTRYYIRARGSHRLELRESFTPHTSWRLKLFVSDAGVLERHLISLLGEEIREDLDLPYLDLGFAESDLADGFALDDYANGHRVLRLNDVGPVAAAPDRTLEKNSEKTSHACGVHPPTSAERHTAMGDARWVARWHDAIMPQIIPALRASGAAVPRRSNGRATPVHQ